jgi:hypothetical protein
MKVYNMLPKCFKSPLMRVVYAFQVFYGSLKHIASAFQGLDLIFEIFDKDRAIVWAFSRQ